MRVCKCTQHSNQHKQDEESSIPAFDCASLFYLLYSKNSSIKMGITPANGILPKMYTKHKELKKFERPRNNSTKVDMWAYSAL